MTFRALLAGCWFSHQERIRERIGGKVHFVCPRCDDAIPANSSEVIKGPRHTPVAVEGQPRMVAKIVRADNVIYDERIRR